MNKIIILSMFLLFIGDVGCTLERSRFSAIPAHERRSLSEKTSAASQKRGTKPAKASSPIRSSTSSKQQSIPPLKKRVAKSAIVGEYVTYVVQPGENLSQITLKHYGICTKDLLQAMKKANEIEKTDTVQAGWNLILPVMDIDGEKKPETAPKSSWPAGRKEQKKITSAKVNLYAANQKSAQLPETIPAEDPKKTNKDIDINELTNVQWQQGIASFEKKDYPRAHQAFSSLMVYGKNRDQCQAYLNEIETQAAMHLDKGLGFYRKRNYSQAIREIEKACIPSLEIQTMEYLFKSHFEIALKNFLQFKRTGIHSYFVQAQSHLNQARHYRSQCLECRDYEEIFKKTHYNNGIKYFTDNDGEGMDKAVEEWEKVRFIDPKYKEVSENIAQAEALIKKLKRIKKVS